MTNRLFSVAVLAVLLPAFSFAESPEIQPVRVQLVAQNTSIRPGDPFLAAVHFKMSPGWHIYGKNPGDTGLPTTVSWDLPRGFTVSELPWPALQRFTLQGIASDGYGGEVSLLSRITPPADLSSGNVTIRAHATWLACRIECTPGKADVSFSLPVGPGAPVPDPRWAALTAAAARPVQPPHAYGFLLALALAFVGGLILNLMPCVLPVISLKVLSFVRNSQESGAGALRHGLMFGAGVLVSFWVIAGILVGLRSAGQLVGWGFQFQSPAVVTVTASLFFLIALNLLGVFELPSIRLRGPARTGLAGSFMSGLLATAVATPCTAPFMGGALGYALTQPPAAGFGVFTALAIGLAAPYVVLSALPRLSARIPKPGPWMVTLQQILAFPMLAAVIWMMYVLETLAGFPALLTLLSALLLAGLGAWIYGRWGGLDRRPGSRLVSAALAVALIVGATAYSAARSAGASAPPAETGAVADPASSPSWESWSSGRVEQLQAAGTPVFVDFTAKWCLTCQVNEKVVLRSPAVARAFRDAGVATLKADWTDRNDDITRTLASFGRAGVPVYALYPGDSQAQPILLPEILTPGAVVEALQSLR